MKTTVLAILHITGVTILTIGVIFKLNELPYHQPLMITGLGFSFLAGALYWLYIRKKGNRE